MKKLKNSIPLLLALVLIVTALNLSPVTASPTAVSVYFPVSESNSSINDYSPGDRFSVFINIEGVTDLFGYEFKLKYDPDVLTANRTIVGPFFGSDYEIFKDEIDDTLGYVWLCVTQTTVNNIPEPGVSGDGRLASIVFDVDWYGGSCLSLSDTSIHGGYYQNDVMLQNSLGNPIDVTIIDGYFVSSPVGLHDIAITSVTPSATSVIEGNTVDVTVIARNYGNFTESFTVTAYANATAIGTQPVTLDSSSRADLTFTWDTTSVELGKYIITASATTVPGEKDKTDNTYTMAWDFSEKTYVDITITVIDYPTAVFTYSPTSPFVFEEVTFNASDSTPNGGEMVYYRWQAFGIAGEAAGFVSPVGTEEINIYALPLPGTYNITLTVEDSEGLTDTTLQTITAGIPSCKLSGWEFKVNNAAGEGKGHKSTTGTVNLFEACVINTEATRDIYVQVVFKVKDAAGVTVASIKSDPSEAVPAGKTTIVSAIWLSRVPDVYYITAYLFNQDISETIILRVKSA